MDSEKPSRDTGLVDSRNHARSDDARARADRVLRRRRPVHERTTRSRCLVADHRLADDYPGQVHVDLTSTISPHRRSALTVPNRGTPTALCGSPRPRDRFSSSMPRS